MEGEEDAEAWPGRPSSEGRAELGCVGFSSGEPGWPGSCLPGLGTALCCAPPFRCGCHTARRSLSSSVVQPGEGGYFEACTCTPAGRAPAAHWLSLQPTLYPLKMGIRSGGGCPPPSGCPGRQYKGACLLAGSRWNASVLCHLQRPRLFGTAPPQFGSDRAPRLPLPPVPPVSESGIRRGSKRPL